jgi:PPP family 3-phenylpropionic acid transporter
MHATRASLPYWQLSGFYFFWAAVIGALMPYWGLYLRHQGHDEAAIGSLMAILLGTQLVAPYIWGYLADRTGQRMRFVRLGIWLALGCFCGVFVDGGTGWMMLVLLGFGFFWNAMGPQFEALTLGYLRGRPDGYSRIRLWGSIGFIVTVMALGALLDLTGIAYLPWFITTLLVLVVLASYAVSDDATLVQQRPPAGSVVAILRRPPVLIFFLTCFLMQASQGPYNTFFSIHLANHGYSGSAIGLLWSLGTTAEVGVFLLMHRLLGRCALPSILLASLLLTALRWWLIGSYADQPGIMLLAQSLHGATYGAFHAAAIELVRRYFSDGHAGQGQALYGGVAIGLGNAVGALYSGALWQALGPTQTFWCGAIIALLAAILCRQGIRAAPDPQPSQANPAPHGLPPLIGRLDDPQP